MRPSFIPVPVFSILLAFLYLFPRKHFSFEPLWLLPILNIVFVAFIVAKGYLATGSFSLLTLRCGVLIYGLSSLVAGQFGGGPNLNVTAKSLRI